MPANSNIWSANRGRIAARCALLLLPAGSWLAFSLAGHADEPPAQQRPGDALTATRSLSPAAAAGQPSARPNSTRQTSVPGALGEPVTVDSHGLATLDDRRGLSIGDRLFFRIIEDNDDPRQLVVTDSGDVEVPYVGRVQVRGMTCKHLAEELKKKLEANYYHHATVIVSVDTMGQALGKVYAAGALRKPGRLEIPGNEVFTVSKAVLCAGGFADYADKHNVKVTRRYESRATNEVFTVDVGQVLEKGRTELDLRLEPGDMIFVPERFNIF